ncbi:Fc.00g028480.m01.CDS01 [Cosmosporella sp. VM-42]
MVWPFSSDPRGDAIRSGTAIPNRQERQVCWLARDAYFSCLDKNNIIDATKDASAAAKACPQQTADFERDCAAAWVKYFKQWRVADIQKQRRLEELRKQGAQEMVVSTSFAPEGGAAEKGKGRGDIQEALDRKKGR